MAPQQVENQVNRWDSTSDCREAGVLILCYPHQSDASLAPELHLILTRRNTYPGVHSGQISLPGGRREGNESLQATALREAEEEIGVNPQSVQVIGQLSSLFT
ncbi:MAG: CoA pyrophosphatase, partial [Anaerolineae bacterium]|nr:CoA pyrophosphatase [Anaerolineae bacterium]